MELQKLVSLFKDIFSVDDITDLKEEVYKSVISHDTEKYKRYMENIGELETDNIQKIFQYYFADRKEKKQDYTPKSLSCLATKTLESDNLEDIELIDLCSGSGALIIGYLAENKNNKDNINIIAYELDANVIPFLLFNLAIRNIKGEVYQSDVLKNAIYRQWKIESTDKFSIVREVENDKNFII